MTSVLWERSAWSKFSYKDIWHHQRHDYTTEFNNDRHNQQNKISSLLPRFNHHSSDSLVVPVSFFAVKCLCVHSCDNNMVACDALPLQFRLTYCIVTNDWTNLEEVVIKVAVHKGNTDNIDGYSQKRISMLSRKSLGQMNLFSLSGPRQKTEKRWRCAMLGGPSDPCGRTQRRVYPALNTPKQTCAKIHQQ